MSQFMPTHYNVPKAIVDAGHAGGTYLDKVRKSDLSSFTKAQWNEFISAICDGFCAGMGRHCGMEMAVEEIPF